MSGGSVMNQIAEYPEFTPEEHPDNWTPPMVDRTRTGPFLFEFQQDAEAPDDEFCVGCWLEVPLTAQRLLSWQVTEEPLFERVMSWAEIELLLGILAEVFARFAPSWRGES